MPAALGREERKKVITENEGLETELHDTSTKRSTSKRTTSAGVPAIVISVGKSQRVDHVLLHC
jgi:hypothetical protein